MMCLFVESLAPHDSFTQTLHSQSHVEFGVAIHFELIYSVHSDWSGCIAEGRTQRNDQHDSVFWYQM